MIGSPRSLFIVAAALQTDAGGVEGREMRATADWAEVLQLANAHFVGPAMFVSLRDAGQLGELPEAVCDYLAFLHACNAKRNEVLASEALEIVRALNNAGVHPLLLKGALTLFGGPYADPGVRMVGDLDILLPATGLSPTLEALTKLGHHLSTRFPEGHHAFGEFVRPGDPAAIDIHIELVDSAYVLPASEVWSRAFLIQRDGATMYVPAPADRLLHHLLHAQIHYLGNFYRGRFELRQLYEFASLGRALAAEIDWPAIVTRLRRHRLEVALHSYLLLANRLLRMPWPLTEPPYRAAVLHCWRCLMQPWIPGFAWLSVPWGNLRSAFAWHRMHALYGGEEFLGLRPLRHAWQYWRKRDPRGIVGRLFRMQ